MSASATICMVFCKWQCDAFSECLPIFCMLCMLRNQVVGCAQLLTAIWLSRRFPCTHALLTVLSLQMQTILLCCLADDRAWCCRGAEWRQEMQAVCVHLPVTHRSDMRAASSGRLMSQ